MSAPPFDSPSDNGNRRLVGGLGAVVAIGSVLALIGWQFETHLLQSTPRSPKTVPNAAIGLLLAGISLLLCKEPVTPRRRRIVRAAALGVALIGFATLAEYLLGRNLRIDQLLIAGSPGTESETFPGRPGFPTAWALIFVGLALGRVDARTGKYQEMTNVLVVLAMSIALLALTGHACGVPSFYGSVKFWPGTGMSLLTAILITLLGVGLIASRPRRGLMAILRSAGGGGIVARRLILLPVALPLLLGLLQLAARRTGVYTAYMDWPQLGGWLFSLLNIAVFTSIIWWSASVVHRADLARADAESRLRGANLQLEMLNAELEDRVSRRTAELTEKTEELRVTSQQLWHTVKLATMGELAANIAHELNNPLATVGLHLETLMEDAAPSSPSVARFQVIERELDRVARLVANLLQFSRPGQQQISTLDVHEELERTLDIVHDALRQHRVDIERGFASDLPMIQADRQKLRQVFLNLLVNASHAMSSGGTLTLRTRRLDDPAGNPSVAIELKDTGTGIPPEAIPRVMEPFYTTRRDGSGTGLGLAICRRIVHEHRGTIRLTSELGRGTTVHIVLPVTNGANGTYAND